MDKMDYKKEELDEYILDDRRARGFIFYLLSFSFVGMSILIYLEFKANEFFWMFSCFSSLLILIGTLSWNYKSISKQDRLNNVNKFIELKKDEQEYLIRLEKEKDITEELLNKFK